LEMGIGDVIVQPSVDEDIETVLNLSFCRVKQKQSRLHAILEREAELFWRSAHKHFPNLPKMKDGLEEPGIGAKLGRYHEVVSVLNDGKKTRVFLAVDNRTKEPRALKCVPKVCFRTCDEVRRLEKEVATMKKLSHPNVVAIFGETQSSRHLMLLLQFGGRRNLFQVIGSKEEKCLPVEEARFLWKQVVDALAHCHSHDITHRDIKLESVAITDDGTTARLISFGYAERAIAPFRYQGSMPFIAPEVMLMDKSALCATAADVWAVGVLLLEMLLRMNFLPRILGWEKAGMPDNRHAQQVKQLFSGPQQLHRLWDGINPKLRQELAEGDFLTLLTGMLTVAVPERWPVNKVQRASWVQTGSKTKHRRISASYFSSE